MFAEEGEELQKMIGVHEEYCRKWRFDQCRKSKVMVCGSKEQIKEEAEEWWYAGKEMGRVSEYKYVGVLVTDDC